MVRLTGRPDMTVDVYRGRKTTIQQQPNVCLLFLNVVFKAFYHYQGYTLINYINIVKCHSDFTLTLLAHLPQPKLASTLCTHPQ